MPGVILEGAVATAQELRTEDAATSRRGGGVARSIAFKVLSAAITMLFVLVFNFFLFRIIPADPAKNLVHGSTTVSAKALAQLNATFGLNKPLLAQFWNYLTQTLQGHLGRSFINLQPVSQVIGQRIWPTVLLVGSSTILATLIGLWIGIRAGWRRGGRFDKTSTAICNILYAMPDFWLGMVLLLLFASKVVIFPDAGMRNPVGTGGGLASFADVLWHLTLPCLVLTLVLLAEYSLIMRSSIVDELGADYLQTARAKGMRDRLVRRRHAVPNALLPSITLVMMNLGFVISGAITTETVFSWPGLGQLTFQALNAPDYPTLEACFLLFSAAVIVANLIGDVLLTILDPRVRQA